MDPRGYYKALGLTPGATKAEVREKFLKLAKKHHPDQKGKDEDYQQVKDAYDCLYHDVRRWYYHRDRYDPNRAKEYEVSSSPITLEKKAVDASTIYRDLFECEIYRKANEVVSTLWKDDAKEIAKDLDIFEEKLAEHQDCLKQEKNHETYYRHLLRATRENIFKPLDDRIKQVKNAEERIRLESKKKEVFNKRPINVLQASSLKDPKDFEEKLKKCGYEFRASYEALANHLNAVLISEKQQPSPSANKAFEQMAVKVQQPVVAEKLDLTEFAKITIARDAAELEIYKQMNNALAKLWGESGLVKDIERYKEKLDEHKNHLNQRKAYEVNYRTLLRDIRGKLYLPLNHRLEQVKDKGERDRLEGELNTLVMRDPVRIINSLRDDFNSAPSNAIKKLEERGKDYQTSYIQFAERLNQVLTAQEQQKKIEEKKSTDAKAAAEVKAQPLEIRILRIFEDQTPYYVRFNTDMNRRHAIMESALKEGKFVDERNSFSTFEAAAKQMRDMMNHAYIFGESNLIVITSPCESKGLRSIYAYASYKDVEGPLENVQTGYRVFSSPLHVMPMVSRSSQSHIAKKSLSDYQSLAPDLVKEEEVIALIQERLMKQQKQETAPPSVAPRAVFLPVPPSEVMEKIKELQELKLEMDDALRAKPRLRYIAYQGIYQEILEEQKNYSPAHQKHFDPLISELKTILDSSRKQKGPR